MIGKCVLILIILGCIEAELYNNFMSGSCPLPRLEHGRVRMRQRTKLAKFICLPRYELVGNKYATCKNGRWDVPLPVCVRPSCPLPEVPNGIRIVSHSGAFVIFFCLPNHKLIGSQVIYCDGMRWNASAPACVDTTAIPKLSCDFEDKAICGWTQDDLHDFDWTRINTKTPSWFQQTGPSYDHTLGKNEFGYYMYIESTSKIENDTARLISPVYESSLAKDGCFSMYYHMYGEHCGGLRVYQKPDNITLRRMLYLSEDEKQTYLLFERWGNLGDVWLNSVSVLKDFSVDFQIVIEGIRGKSFRSDIAIDDVAILQGENCTGAMRNVYQEITTPSGDPSSCAHRCFLINKETRLCSCDFNCINRSDCCADFFDTCIFAPDSTTQDTTASIISDKSIEEAPQTLKLVAVTTESTSSTPLPTTRTTSTTRLPTTSTTSTTSSSTSTTTTTVAPTTTRRATTRKLTVKPSTTTKYTKFSTAAPSMAPARTTLLTSSTTSAPTIKLNRTTYSYKVPTQIKNDSFLAAMEKAKKEQDIERKFNPKEVKPPQRAMSTGSKATIVILAIVICSVACLVIITGLRSSRGQLALARLRGRQTRDPEVRFLSNDVDDDD